VSRSSVPKIAEALGVSMGGLGTLVDEEEDDAR
jgi:hypothetical protein